MIIKDDQGDVIVGSKVTLLVSQNGNEWKLTDEGVGITLELITTASHYGIAAVPLAFRTIMIKPDSLPNSVIRRTNGKAAAAK